MSRTRIHGLRRPAVHVHLPCHRLSPRTAPSRASWPRSVASVHDVSDRFPWLGSTHARRPRCMSCPNPRTGVGGAVWPRSVPPEWPSQSTIRGSPLSAVYSRGSRASLHLIYLTPSSPFILPSRIGGAVWPRFVPPEWPSQSTIRGSPLSAVYSRGSRDSLHLIYLTPSSPFIFPKPSYLQLEPHQTYNTTYAYAMHLIEL
ncbi:hypothetical protein DY000_02007819 [Brassica cretica]|uniref:Uncharacterized protein n=1 Tax=Brassica cretica TaxID=69181 RepID=A0ABQ7C749_BRACR|nr:hypothetical protein DY000_02007819 [Brassica cretica]